MALNLSRNTKVYFTTNIAANTNVVASTGFTNSNTWEIQVLDGYKFTQNTNQQTIQPREAGATPTRGQRSFNTDLAPVDWNFTTYIRPELASGKVTCAEKFLWNAMLGNTALSTSTLTAVSGISRASTATGLCTATGAAGFGTQFAVGDTVNIVNGGYSFDGAFTVLSTASTTITYTDPYLLTTDPVTATGAIMAGKGQWFEASTAYAMVTMAATNTHTLQPFGIVFKVDNAFYAVDNCAVDKADVDFGIDAISQIAWTGKGTAVRDLLITSAALITSTGFAAITAPSATANFITNKLSTLQLISNIEGIGGTTYTVPITGGSLSISNNLTYLTPQILGKVNTPIGYSVGTRAVSGTLTAYLKTGAGESSTLLKDILTAAATAVDNAYYTLISMGGSTSTIKVDFDMPAVMLQVPTVDVQDVVSTTLNFTAQSYDQAGSVNTTSAYNIDNANELKVKYFAV